MTRSIARLEKMREILLVDFEGYIALAAEVAPVAERSWIVDAFGLLGHKPRWLLTVQELGLNYEDLLVMAMGAAEEHQLGPLVALFPDLYAEIEDAAAPLRDDGAADRAYDMARDRAVGL